MQSLYELNRSASDGIRRRLPNGDSRAGYRCTGGGKGGTPRRCAITRHGRPAGVLIGFRSEDDWFDYRLENDPRFLSRIEAARESLRSRRGVPIEEVAEG